MSVYVGESRGELIAWLRDALNVSITKVEECGKGVVYCEILQSIYGDLPMSRLKFDAKMEYEYLDNMKVLQKAFTKHRIDKPVPVEKLVKCKMQDNLEFLQWMKKFWDANAPGDYVPAQRPAPTATKTARNVSQPRARPTAGTTARSAPSAGARATSASTGGGPGTAALQQHISALTEQVQEMQVTCEGLEKERDFYFAKLRSIELLVTERDKNEDIDPAERDTLAHILEVLYQTEEGFEVPEGEELPLDDDEETF